MSGNEKHLRDVVTYYLKLLYTKMRISAIEPANATSLFLAPCVLGSDTLEPVDRFVPLISITLTYETLAEECKCDGRWSFSPCGLRG